MQDAKWQLPVHSSKMQHSTSSMPNKRRRHAQKYDVAAAHSSVSVHICGFANELASDARYEVATANTLQQNAAQYRQFAKQNKKQHIAQKFMGCGASARTDPVVHEFVSNQLNTATDLGCRVTNMVSAICQQELCR